MRLRVLASLLLICTCVVAVAADVQRYSIEDCFSGATVGTQACRMKISAVYQAIQLAQVKHGLTAKTCQLGITPTAETLLTNLREELRFAAAATPDASIVVLAIGSLTTPLHCPAGVAKQIGGFTAGQLLNLCKLPAPSGGLDVCIAYMSALRDGLTVMSSYEDTQPFLCPAPDKRLVSDKDVAKLFLEELKLDLKVQEKKSAAEVMVEALARKYPCR